MKSLSRTNVCLIGLTLLISWGLFIFVWPAQAQGNPNILMIEITGNPHVPSEKILGVVANLKIGQPFDPQLAELDKQEIMKLGYFNNIEVKTEPLFDGLKVLFRVEEHPLFKEIQLSGLTKFKPEELLPYFTLKPGEIINQVTLQNDLAQVSKFCREQKGYFIQPLSDPQINPDGTIQLQLTEMRYGEIKINGLEKTKEIVIRRELTIKTGDIIDYNILREEYQKLMRLRLFDGLDISFEPASTPGMMDLVINTIEAQTGTFSVGISFSDTTGEFGGLLGFSEANIMGLGQSLMMDLNFSESLHNVQFSFVEPWLDEKHTSFAISLWNTDSYVASTMHDWLPAGFHPGHSHEDANGNDLGYHTYDDLNENSVYDLGLVQTGLSISFGRPFGKDKNNTARIKFSLEKNEIEHFWPSSEWPGYDTFPYPDPHPPEEDDHDEDESFDLPANPLRPFDFWNNSLELSLERNTLVYQDANFVESGDRYFGSFEAAGEYLGGEYNYYKLLLEKKSFHPWLKNLVWGTRLQGVYLTGDYPDYDALYLGGIYRLRGYGDTRFHSLETERLIGESYLLFNTELRYRHPSAKSLIMTLFYDGGMVNNLAGESVFKSDYGFGFRYMIPILGVIRLDQAYNSDGDNMLVFGLGEMF